MKTPRRLTLDNHDSVPEAWTPDNRSLLFVSNRNGKLELPYSDAAESDFFCPQKPGNPCVLGLFEAKSLVFYALDPVRGKGDPLGKIEVDKWQFGWTVSPEGSQLAVVDRSHKDRIEILTLSKSNPVWHEIAIEPGWGDYQSVAWAADGKGFFLTTWLPASFNLVHVTLSGKVQLLPRPNTRS